MGAVKGTNTCQYRGHLYEVTVGHTIQVDVRQPQVPDVATVAVELR